MSKRSKSHQTSDAKPPSTQCSPLTIFVGIALLCLLGASLFGVQGVMKTLEATIQAGSSLQNAYMGSAVNFPLAIPPGEGVALPSLRVAPVNDTVQRGFYGGKGDKAHLGGFTAYDPHGVSPAVWKHMVTSYGVKSVMDVGCGKGISTLWFYLHGVDVLCLEGSHDAVSHTLLPNPATQIVEHDFSRGPYWPGKTYDAVWSVEFLEHVGRNFQYNYIQAFRKAALIFVTHSHWGGWHHVEIHSSDWWRARMESFGFQFSQWMTDTVRKVAADEKGQSKGPNGQDVYAQHVIYTMLVFINPVVASLPEHAHLFAEHGCYGARGDRGTVNRECDAAQQESVLPKIFHPLALTQEQDLAWLQKVNASIAAATPH